MPALDAAARESMRQKLRVAAAAGQPAVDRAELEVYINRLSRNDGVRGALLEFAVPVLVEWLADEALQPDGALAAPILALVQQAIQDAASMLNQSLKQTVREEVQAMEQRLAAQMQQQIREELARQPVSMPGIAPSPVGPSVHAGPTPAAATQPSQDPMKSEEASVSAYDSSTVAFSQ